MNSQRLGLRLRFLTFAIVALASPVAAFGQSGENVAVVINTASPASQQIGEYYARKRDVPEGNVIRIRTAPVETITRATYAADIEAPIRRAIERQGAQDRILYIVLTKGVPLGIEGTEGREGTAASVDSELTLLYRRMTGLAGPFRGEVPNPFFLGGESVRSAVPFSHRAVDIYLVTRLDAFTTEEALSLVDRAMAPSDGGRFVLDQRGGLLTTPTGDVWLAEASRRLTELGFGERVILESTSRPARNIQGVLGYYSWGSNDPVNRVRTVRMQFAPGAVAAMFVPGDARTFQPPPAGWVPGDQSTPREGWYAGSPHALVGDLIRDGATGVAGGLAGQASIRPEILFPAYARGFNLAEAFYLALPMLGGQTVVVGDPLCVPFPRPQVPAADLQPAVDPDTLLPQFFSARRLQALRTRYHDVVPEALTLMLRSEVQVTRGDSAGARDSLTAAVALAPRNVTLNLGLALLDEQAGQHRAASERYRTVLHIDANNVIALNNLAYSLAIREGALEEGRRLARQAAALAPANPLVLDTLGWIEHLSGNDEMAAEVFQKAVESPAASAEVHLHAAVVFAARGDRAAAETHLGLALKLDPALAASEEVRQLEHRLRPPPVAAHP